MSNKYCPVCSSKHTKNMVYVTENKDINVVIVDEYFSLIELKMRFFMINYGINI